MRSLILNPFVPSEVEGPPPSEAEASAAVGSCLRSNQPLDFARGDRGFYYV